MILTLSDSSVDSPAEQRRQRLDQEVDLLTAEALSLPGLLRRLQRAGFTASRRTVINDLRLLGKQLGGKTLKKTTRATTQGIPSDCQEDRQFYRITVKQRQTVRLPDTLVISNDEALALQVARQVLAGAANSVLRGANPLIDALDRLAGRLGIDASQAAPEVTVSSFGQQSCIAAHLTTCLQAVRQVTGLRVTYCRVGSPRQEELDVMPARLTLLDGEWYLAAWVPAGRLVRLLKCAGIEDLELLRPLAAPTSLAAQVDELIRFAFRAHSGQETVRVALRLSSNAFAQLASRRWGERQKSEPHAYPGTPLPHLLQFTTRGMDAVLPWLLQFAGEVAVLSPRILRERAALAAEQLTLAHNREVDASIPLLGEPDDDESAIGACRLEEVQRGVARSVSVALRNPPPKKKLRTRPRVMLQGS